MIETQAYCEARPQEPFRPQERAHQTRGLYTYGGSAHQWAVPSGGHGKSDTCRRCAPELNNLHQH
jgi:hypothetical protein